MTRVVVDTDVVSFIFKNHPIGALYEADLAGGTLLISFMTLNWNGGPSNPIGGRRAANGCGCVSNDSCCCHTVAGSALCGLK